MDLIRQTDRCDRCGAQAFVRAVSRETDHDLLFCGHHYAEYEMTLVWSGWIIEDERDKINRAPSASAGVL